MAKDIGKQSKREPAKQNTQKGLPVNARLSLVAAIIAFVVYANSLSNDFAHDDLSVITKNTIVTKGIQAIPEILSTPYRHGFFTTSNDLYRPLSLVMFAAEYQLSDGGPVLFHLVNVLLFAGCVVMLFLFLDRLFEGRKTMAAFIASLLFAVHPVHTEVVANIKSRDELLCFFFAFLSLLLFLKYVKKGKATSLLTGFLCFFLSLLSKETVISFLAVIPLVFFFYRNNAKRKSLYILGCCVTAVACFLIIRLSVLHSYHADHFNDIKFIDNALVNAPTAASRLATEILIMGRYLALLLVPYPLVCDYSYNCIPFASFSDWRVWVSAAVYIFLVVISIARLIKNRTDVFAFGILLFLFTMAMFSNVFLRIGAEMAERFVFFGSAGFCWIMALLIEFLVLRWNKSIAQNSGFDFRKNRKTWYVIAATLVIYAGISMQRNSEWKNNLALYKADVKKLPANARLYYFLGNELLLSLEGADAPDKQGITRDAVANLQTALSIYPGYDDAHRVIGNGYFFLSQFDSAIFHLKRAIYLNPGDMEAMNNLNVVYFNTQRYEDAIGVCKGMITMDSQYAEGYNDMAICYLRLKRYDSAIYILNLGLLKNNNYNPFYENLALSHKLNGDVDAAKKYEALARKQHPGFTVF